MYCLAVHSDYGVPPFAQTIAFDISVGNVDTPCIAYFTVYYYYLSVIAVVYLAKTEF